MSIRLPDSVRSDRLSVEIDRLVAQGATVQSRSAFEAVLSDIPAAKKQAGGYDGAGVPGVVSAIVDLFQLSRSERTETRRIRIDIAGKVSSQKV